VKLQKARTAFGKVITGVGYLAFAALFVMVFIVAVDVILRKTGVGRIHGSNEYTTSVMVIICMLGIPVLQYKKGHVWVPLFVTKYPKKMQPYFMFGVMLVETVIVAFMAIGGYQKIVMFAERHTTTDVLNIPRSWLAVIALIGIVEYFVLMIMDTIQLFLDGRKGPELAESEAEGWSEDDVKGI